MIIDACLFFNELDLLELRLSELAAVVDRFVIVEANRTHKGTLKPLYFAENHARFAQWEDKIVHVVCALPGDEGIPAIRRREMMQRNAILQGVKNCQDDDVILISDCDEIPRAHLIPRYLDDGIVATYLQKLYYFNFNTYAPTRVWPGTRVCRISDARALSPHVIRNGIAQPDGQYPLYMSIEDGGWHYSYFGGVEKIQEKMTEFLHQELVTGENTTRDAIQDKVAKGADIWGRDGEQSFVIGAADDLPYTVLRELNSPKWAGHFAPEWMPTYHEDWYSGGQALYVGQLARQAPVGALVEIGCWEGRSTVVLAQMVAPRILHCVDHWKGNTDEDPNHDSGRVARERNVYQTFAHNMQALTSDNIGVYHDDWQTWIREWPEWSKNYDHGSSIAFLHLDASHDRASVRDCLLAIKPYLVPGAVLCGDDTFHEDVALGVHDVFPNAEVVGGRLWQVVHE